MTKVWIGSLYYFLNVLLHIGVLIILFFVSIPENVTILEHGAVFWQSAEGKELTLLNISLLVANLVFALSTLLLAPRSYSILVRMAVIAWLILLGAYYAGTIGLVAYAAAAIHLTACCYFQGKQNRNPI